MRLRFTVGVLYMEIRAWNLICIVGQIKGILSLTHVHLWEIVARSSRERERRAMIAANISWFVLSIAVGVLLASATRVAATEGK